MATMKKLVRVRSLRALVVLDDDVTIHIIPKGMQGILVGASPDSKTEKQHSFSVQWDFHAVGDSVVFDEPEGEPACIEPGFPVDTVPLDAIEVIAVQEV
jgi:hypothetical protein